MIKRGRNPLAGLLDAKDREKAVLLALLTVPLNIFYLCWLVFTWHFTHFGQAYMQPASINVLISLYLISCACWVVLYATGLLLRRMERDPWIYTALVLNFYGLSLVPQGYMIGLMTPLTGVILLGAALVGFILFDFRRVLFAFILGLFLIALFSWLTAAGRIPYAPLFNALPVSKTTAEPYWIVSQFLLALPFVTGAFALNQALLGRWRAREAATQRLSMTDELTGLANRRAILNSIRHELARTSRSGIETSVVLLDLDHFKAINDTYGHDIGDRVLKKTATVLTTSVRSADWVGRYGGEEFIVLLPDTPGTEAAMVIERCRQQIEESPLLMDNGERLTVTASFGIVSLSGEQVDPDEALKRADQALYEAKEAGRNRITHWQAQSQNAQLTT